MRYILTHITHKQTQYVKQTTHHKLQKFNSNRHDSYPGLAEIRFSAQLPFYALWYHDSYNKIDNNVNTREQKCFTVNCVGLITSFKLKEIEVPHSETALAQLVGKQRSHLACARVQQKVRSGLCTLLWLENPNSMTHALSLLPIISKWNQNSFLITARTRFRKR